MRREIVGVMLTLLLTSIAALAFNIQPARASGNIIYIKADGRIEPPGAPISTTDKVTYALTANITDRHIVVERSNIVFDGKGYTLQGQGSETGIHLQGVSNVTIKNTNIKNHYCGILLDSSSNSTISGNSITANRWFGIGLNYSSNSTIFGNNIANNGVGIRLDSSSNSTISGNNVANNWVGIMLGHSSNNRISGNNVTANNNYGIWLHNSSDNHIYHNDFIGNIQGQAYVPAGDVNAWDDGYPSGGNYWSDYRGRDEKKGPKQDQLGSDGIGDTPYAIPPQNIDRYPLMNPIKLGLEEESGLEEVSPKMISQELLTYGLLAGIGTAIVAILIIKRRRTVKARTATAAV